VESKKVSAQNRGKSCHVSAHQHLRKVDSRPELRIPAVAAQTRMVSVARIRLDFRKSVGLFKAIICDDISEFEQSGLCGVTSGLQIERGLPLELPDDVPQDPLLMLLRQHFCLMGAK
jgi:hypothetical protein